ncbi:MAG: DUF3419 family protein [Alphaproteobacteria bacterium]|nr:DUF3419 family protein [Alphaproteobacteria bacterium]
MSESNGVFISPSYAFQDMGPVYLFTNENISGTLKTAGDISGARVLTVGASGDHAFEGLLAGASRVDTFDINSAQKNVIELKSHMIQHLGYSDFMNFFFDSHDFFYHKILHPIQPYFSKNLNDFLKICTGENMRSNFKYRAAHTSDYNIKNLQYIATPQNYERLRTHLVKKPDFIHCDIANLSAKLTGKYDLILLSNIFDYMYSNSRDTEERLTQFSRNILSPLITNNLNPSGRVYFHYMWGANPGAWINFVQYYSSKHNPKLSLTARTINAAYHSDEYDVVLYASQKHR